MGSGEWRPGTTHHDLRLPVLIAVAEVLHEAPLLVRERAHALGGDLLQQAVHAAFVGRAGLGLALQLLGGTGLLPALPPAPARLRRRRGLRLVALHARVTLRGVVAED